MALLKRLIKLLVSLLVRAWDILVAGALLRLGSRPRPTCVVIYYHAIDAAQRSRFARQMDELLRLAKPIPADLAALAGDDAHCCAVTFDDGFVSVLENALPELEARNIPATFFVPTGCMGQAPGWAKPNSPARRQRVLSADQLATLKHHRLLTIGSHSVSHPDFLKLDPAQARRELEQSKAQLETILGRKVGLFSFPHGKCDPATIELARAAGYERVFTINPLNAFSSADNFVQGRVAVDPADCPLEFRLKVLGAYRWLSRSVPSSALRPPPSSVLCPPSSVPRPPTPTISVDQTTESEWNSLLPRFADASLYQTWAYGAVSWGEKNLSHLLLKQDGQVVAMAQFRIVRVPLLPCGIAYLRWGPLYRLRDGSGAPETVLPALMQAITCEYARRRRLLVRILPNGFQDDPAAPVFEGACAKFGFQPGTVPTYRTIRVDLSLSPELIRKRLDGKWRNQLNASERNGLTVLEGASDDLFARFTAIYRELLARKQFETAVNIDEFARIQRALPEPLKMRVLLCEKDGKTLAGLIGTSIGDTGVYLLGATSSEGMKAKGSYLLQWRMMQWLRENGCVWYDLGGINPQTNPGVYHFKSGFGGAEVFQLVPSELSGSSWSKALVCTAERMKRAFSSRTPARPRPAMPLVAASGKPQLG